MPDRERVILQVALDFVDLDRALKCAAEAVAGGADWLEAGTPLIKSEGLDAVRALREKFPDRTIVADMKIMDAGRTELEAAAKAGADIVDVLGAAADSTIAECIEAARNYGNKVVVDLISCGSPVERARQIEQLGADYIACHTAIDVQMQGVHAFDVLEQVCKAVNIPVAAAGGIHSENATEAVAAGARVVIVGGAITKSAEAKAATEAIRQAIDTGAKVATDLYKRATMENIREVLSKVSTANLSDALHRGGVLPGIYPITPGARMCGPALTVRSAPGDWAKPVEAIDEAQQGDVIVIDAGGVGPALWGELATYSALNKQVAGLVIDGAIRDTPEIRRVGFPAFARLIMPNAGEPRGFGEIGVPIKAAGVVVRPGDWVVGDDDGVCVVPREKAAEYANRAQGVLEQENRIRKEIQEGSTLSSVTHLMRWEKAG
ncbi:MAG: orotidine 5'-phosphate decarboxylase [Armatimonadota bacterium]|nr:MAG: orotidine 5'-phosphate decarboxylase [Armatimonadota bacterium]